MQGHMFQMDPSAGMVPNRGAFRGGMRGGLAGRGGAYPATAPAAMTRGGFAGRGRGRGMAFSADGGKDIYLFIHRYLLMPSYLISSSTFTSASSFSVTSRCSYRTAESNKIQRSRRKRSAGRWLGLRGLGRRTRKRPR